MTKAMGLFVLQDGFWFAFKLTDCSYRFKMGSTAWHAIIILFPYGKWLKIPCLRCYLFISKKDKYWSYAVANNLLFHCLTEYWFPCDSQNEVGKAACLFGERSCRKCRNLGNTNNMSSLRWSIQKKPLRNFCRKGRILDFEMHWKAQFAFHTKVKLQMNFWTGTTEFSGTVFH